MNVVLPRKEVIEAAERNRSTGKYKSALLLLEGVLSVTEAEVSNLTTGDMVRYLTALRICFGSHFSISKRSINPFSTLRHFKFAQSILKIYIRPGVLEAASKLKVGIYGETYRFKEEMIRDMAHYSVFLGELSGEVDQQTVDSLMRLAQGLEESPLKALFVFEAQCLSYKLKQTKETINNLVKAGEYAILESSKICNYERAATIAARLYLLEPSFIAKQLSLIRYEQSIKADPNCKGILEREQLKAKIEKYAIPIRRIFYALTGVKWSHYDFFV